MSASRRVYQSFKKRAESLLRRPARRSSIDQISISQDVPQTLATQTEEDVSTKELARDHFRFLDLPPELRNKIYELALIQRNILLPSYCNHPNRPSAAQPSLTKTCRKIRKESLEIFYGMNIFDIHIHRCDFSPFFHFMKAIGPSNRKLMTRVNFTLKDVWTCGSELLHLVYWFTETTNVENLRFSIDTQEWWDNLRAEGSHVAPILAMDRTKEMLATAIRIGNSSARNQSTGSPIMNLAWLEESRHRCSSICRLNGSWKTGYCTFDKGTVKDEIGLTPLACELCRVRSAKFR